MSATVQTTTVSMSDVTKAVRELLRTMKPGAIQSIDVMSPTGEMVTVEVPA